MLPSGRCGGGVEAVWRWCGGCVEAAWRLCGGCVEAVSVHSVERFVCRV